MALSSSESELLTQTCESMNVAANTCREVLEMLRNLGNTGVVDIAIHNNSQGAHANDATLFHVTGYSDGSQRVALGDKHELPFDPFSLNVGPTSVSNTTYSYTFGRDSGVDTGSREETWRFLSDGSYNRIAFENSSYNNMLAMHYSLFALVDSNGKDVRAGFVYSAGKKGTGLSSYVPPYAAVKAIVSNGTYSQFSYVAEFNGDGIVPSSNNTISLGVSGDAFKDIFLVNQPTVSSDRRIKKDVSALGSQAVDFIKALRPVSYRLKQGEGRLEQYNEQGEIVPNDTPDREGIRTHWGLIAQEVKEALSTAGYEDAALWCLANKDDPDSQQSLRYEELIAPMIKVIQNQQERIEALERKVA